jgi:metal-dependent hydrolase (beta-lactamase superfamily II)
MMEAKVVNVYNDRILLNMGLKGGWGESFHITVGDREVFFDVGYKGNTLMRNVHALGIDIDKVEKLVLSHGHRDHTSGLVSFLEARTAAEQVTPILQRHSFECNKRARAHSCRVNIRMGFGLLFPFF